MLCWFAKGLPIHLTRLVAVILFFAVALAWAQPADVQFASNTLSTDLPLAESKDPIHWLCLKCRLTDGGSGTLTLDPSVPKFNEFGDPVAVGKPPPPVTLACTLKLTKMDNGRHPRAEDRHSPFPRGRKGHHALGGRSAVGPR